MRLHEPGCFSWPEWAATLAAVLREVRDRGEVDDGSRYYDHWLVALERLVTAKQLLSPSMPTDRAPAIPPAAQPAAVPSGPMNHPDGMIEIALPGGVSVRVDAQVDSVALRRVLAALTRR